MPYVRRPSICEAVFSETVKGIMSNFAERTILAVFQILVFASPGPYAGAFIN